MASSLLTGIYTLTPTHCGTGQTSGAVDLPIAREPHTGFPVLPASGLKGAARSTLDETKTDERRRAQRLFGPALPPKYKVEKSETEGDNLGAGSLVLLEGRLLLYPLRSLQRPFLYATCPMILERLERDLRALGMGAVLEKRSLPDLATFDGTGNGGPKVLVSDDNLAGKTLVIEDLVYKSGEVGKLVHATALAKLAQALLPVAERGKTGQRIEKDLVVLNDTDFADLVRRVVPVQARIHLDDATKTTSGEQGNLWYEEALPPDCLFAVPVATRAGFKKSAGDKEPGEEFKELLQRKESFQIGGNETVGQGFCWWTVAAQTEV